MSTYYLHDYVIDTSDAHLVYLRKADDIDQRTMKDELDDYLQTKILLQYPKATENIEVINGWSGIQKWDAALLNHWHLTANYRSATSVGLVTMISINYASVLVPQGVSTAAYQSVGRHSSIPYIDYNRIFLAHATNPPLLLQQHPLIHGIECYRFFEMPATADPEKVFFMYHDQTGRVRAVVNHTTGIVGLSYSSDPSGKLIIDQDLDELVNGSYMSLNLNQDKQLFQKSKQMLLKELAQRTSAIDKDFEKYLHQAEEL